LAGAVAAYGLPRDTALAAYRAASPSAGPGDLLAAIQGDWYFRVPVLRLADAHAKSVSATFMYEFAWRSPQFDGRLGACHGLEIAFVFDAHGEATEPLGGAHPPRSLTNAMHSAWIAFAATGDPGWHRYDLRERATMRFDTVSKLVGDLRSMERTLWEGVR
jgi:para-nitrobenzyl esterase